MRFRLGARDWNTCPAPGFPGYDQREAIQGAAMQRQYRLMIGYLGAVAIGLFAVPATAASIIGQFDSYDRFITAIYDIGIMMPFRLMVFIPLVAVVVAPIAALLWTRLWLGRGGPTSTADAFHGRLSAVTAGVLSLGMAGILFG
jgi:hypothetical protein